jgi:amino acid permease
LQSSRIFNGRSASHTEKEIGIKNKKEERIINIFSVIKIVVVILLLVVLTLFVTLESINSVTYVILTVIGTVYLIFIHPRLEKKNEK